MPGGSERANYQLFLTELTALLDLPTPEPAGSDTRDNGYVFERRVDIRQPDGSVSSGYIDLYRRGAFVCEAKQTGRTLDTSGWDLAPALVGRPGATTPLPDKPAEQAAAEEDLLTRLVALNAERAAEEARGLVRWLRPAYQNPQATEAPSARQDDLDIAETDGGLKPALRGKADWLKAMREQVAAVRAALAAGPLTHEAIAARFKRRPAAPVAAVLDALEALEALEALGMVSREGADWRL